MADDSRLVAGRYRLEAVLGDGGMGRVWRAHDETLGRAVAVKEVRFPSPISERERETLCERTMREARLTAQLSHPGVVTTYDAVVEDDHPYVVMELVPSTSLAQRVARDGPVAPEEVARIGLTLLDALAVAHRHGIVHRDVKPSNVLLADDGRVLLSDFGIATRESDPALTTTGMLVGSPAYMSPERLRSARAGFEADVWSLGATLYTALEGTTPFRAETTMGTITAILTDDVVPPHWDGPLSDAVQGMLVKDQQRRLTLDQARALLARDAGWGEPEPPGDTGWGEPEPPGDTGWGEPEPPGSTTPPVTPAAPAEPVPASTTSGPRRRRGLPALLVGLAALLVVVLGVAGAMWLSDQGADQGADQGGDPAAGPSQTAPSDGAGGSPGGRPDSGGAGDPDGGGQPPQVPAGFRMRRDPLGFRVAVPQGWERRLDGPTRVDFVAPQGDRFVRIDQRAQALPDAVQAWEEAEPAVADSLSGYERIRIDPVPHPTWDVADWEFTWQGGSGRVHVLNRGIATDTRGFALYVSAPDASWQAEGEPLVDVVSDTFRPTA